MDEPAAVSYCLTTLHGRDRVDQTLPPAGLRVELASEVGERPEEVCSCLPGAGRAGEWGRQDGVLPLWLRRRVPWLPAGMRGDSRIDSLAYAGFAMRWLRNTVDRRARKLSEGSLVKR